MKFYVTRHGQTAWNRENLVCGITDLPLDQTGREQARQTAQKLKNTHLRPGDCLAPTAGPPNGGAHLPGPGAAPVRRCPGAGAELRHLRGRLPL